MSHRIVVTSGCTPRCASCVACPAEPQHASLEQAALHVDLPELVLGGGDVTRWQPLSAYLELATRADHAQKVWIEAPARAFSPPVLAALARRKAHGIVVQIEAADAATQRALGAGDGESVIAEAEELGLVAEARLCARPQTLPSLAALAARIAPRPTWLELVRQDLGRAPVSMWPAPIERLLLLARHVSFSGHRMMDRGYLPPCVLPSIWSTRPTAWRSVLSPRTDPNTALSACSTCSLASMCHFADADGLAEETRAEAIPIRGTALPWDRPRPRERDVPETIAKKRPSTDVICVTPWTTMEIVDPDGKARQCCSTWTIGDRGNIVGSSLAEVWNGAGYREARRIMSGDALAPLCIPICSRLHDKKFSEKRLRIQEGSDAFVKNQLLLADEIAERREVIRARPIRMAICPSTYCNYNCIMCDHGRSPRRELPAEIWDELPDFMPTLRTLTLLGGEPLANPLAQRFLRDFDAARWPDAAIDIVTNGSLLTASVLERMGRCTLGDVTMSLNAGTADVYEKVQRGIALDLVLANLDALIRYRDAHRRWFGITLSFVVQPAASHTLVEFGEIAFRRGLPIRLMALNPENHEGLDFYTDPDVVAKVVEDVDRFVEHVRRARPDWLSEVLAVRSAVVEEAAARQAGAPKDRSGPTNARRLPVLV